VRPDDTTEILRLLTARRQEVVELRIATVNRLHVVLCQLIPGGAKRHLSATKARPMLSAVRPRDAVGKARKQLALDYAGELDRLDARLKQLKRQIGEVLAEDPTSLVRIDGIATINAAKILAEVGDVRRFASRHQLHRHRPDRRVLRREQPPPAQPRRQPTPQPRPAHRGRRAVPHARTRSGLLPAQAGGRQDPQRSPALPQATHLRRGLSTPRRRPGSKEPGRTRGGVSSIQRG
jgi:hypothetical protein